MEETPSESVEMVSLGGGGGSVVVKDLLYEHIERVLLPEEAVDHWYSTAKKLIKMGKFSNVISREEVIELAALQLQVIYGDHDGLIGTPKMVSVPEKRRMSIVHPKFRKDQRIQEQMFSEYSRYKLVNKVTAKRRFINIVRVLKRASENVFPCHFYSSDNDVVSIRKILLIISEKIIIMDANNQQIIYDLPIDSIRALTNQHTLPGDREIFKSVKKKWPYLEKRQLLVIDMGPTTSLSLLTENRNPIRNIFETCLNGFIRAQKQVLAEKIEKMGSTAEKNIPITPNPNKFSKSNRYFFKMSMDGDDWREIKIMFYDGNIEIIDSLEEMLLKFTVEVVESWRKARVPKELKQKIESLWGSSGVEFRLLEQVVVCLTSGETYRIYGDVQTLQSKLQRIFHRYGVLYRQQYECVLLDLAKKRSVEANLKFSENQLSFVRAQDKDQLKSVSYLALFGCKAYPAPPEYNNTDKWEPNMKLLDIDFGDNQDPPVMTLLSTENIINDIQTEIQNLIIKLWREYKKQQQHQKMINAHGIPCKIFSRSRGKMSDVTFRVKNSDNTFVVQHPDDQEVLIEVPVDSIGGWVFGINLTNMQDGLLFFSKTPSKAQLSSIQDMVGGLHEVFDASDTDIY